MKIGAGEVANGKLENRDSKEAWIAAQEFTPSKREIFEKALAEFLDKRGG